MNQLKKRIQQKYTFVFFATCIAVSSLTLQCESCKSIPRKEDNKVTIALEATSNITGDEVATLILKKTAGAIMLGDVIFTFTNADRFVTEDGKALRSITKLNEFLGKAAEEKMGDTEIKLKIKASIATQANTDDQKLKIAIGNNTDSDAYVRGKDVVTWKAPTAGITLITKTPIELTNVPGFEIATIKIQKTVVLPLKYSEVLLKFSGDTNSFTLAGGLGGTMLSSFLGPNGEVDLQKFLGKADPTETILNGLIIDLDIQALSGQPSGKLNLNLAIGKVGDATDKFVSTTKVIDYKKVAISVTTADIKGAEVATIKLNKKPDTGKIRYSDIWLHFEGYADFVFSDSNAVPEKIQLHILLNKTDTEVMDYQEILVNIEKGSNLHIPATLKFFVGSEHNHDRSRYAGEHTVNYIP